MTGVASTGSALTSKVDPPLSDTATGGDEVEDVNPLGRAGVVDELAPDREAAELAVLVPQAASASGTAMRTAATAARAIMFL